MKNYLRKFPRIFHILKIINSFRKAVYNVRIDLSSIREFFVSMRGFPGLSRGNYVFYRNFCKNILEKDTYTIIDVGANDGWFARTIYRFTSRINIKELISFEPLRSQGKYLKNLAERYDNFSYESIALGEERTTCELTEYGTTGLSSLKNLRANSYSSHFNTEILDAYHVEVSTLDHYVRENGVQAPIILKVDTQGYEMEVLRGAEKLLEDGKIYGIVIELMLIEKYENSVLFYDILEFLRKYGFNLFDMHLSCHEEGGSLSEFDAVFILGDDINS